MNNFYRYIAFVLLLTVSACSNEFLNENLTTVNNPMGESGIIISPTWDESDYQFSCPGMGDAEFEIVKSLNSECNQIETIIEKFNKQIDLLQEYRTTLISEVVTGKIKVPNTIEA